MMHSSINLTKPDPLAVFAATVLDDYDRAAAARDPWLTLWQDCYELTLPENARFTSATQNPLRNRARLFDGTASDAVDQLAASLLGNLTPPWVNWFGFAPGPDVLDELRGPLTKELERSTTVLQDQVDRSNLYTELHQCFLDLVVGGTACLMLSPARVGDPVSFTAHAVPLSEVVLSAGSTGAFRALYRPRTVTRADLEPFEEILTPEGYDFTFGSQDQTFDIIEFCYLDPGACRNGAVMRIPNGTAVLLYETRPTQSPYIVFRWQKTPGTALGRSPVMKALPDIKTANTVVELILKNASLAVTGIWQADDDGVLNPANIELVPGAIIPKAIGSAGLKPLEMPARFDVSQLVLDDLRARIRHALLVDRFTPATPMRLTATEVNARGDETMLLLGAIYGRLQSELLTPLLTYLYDLLRARGEITDLPLDGRAVVLVHRSPLARAQATRGLQNVATWLDTVAQMGDEARSTVNGPATTRFLAETLGVPESLLKSQENQDLNLLNSLSHQGA